MVGAAGRYGEVISLEGFMCVVFFKLTISVPVMTTVIAENEKVKQAKRLKSIYKDNLVLNDNMTYKTIK